MSNRAKSSPPPPSPMDSPTTRMERPLSSKGDFTWSETDEPHATRRQLILKKHPEIAELFTTEPRTAYISFGILLLQLTMAYVLRDASWWVILLCAYVIGGTVNHSLQLAVHELSHDLCWSGPNKDAANRLTAIVANLATCIPSGQTFKPYHMDHHQYQGVDGVDTDIPHAIELNWVTNTVGKILWIMAQPLCYGLRPMLIKAKPFRFWEGLNWIVQLSFNAAILYFLGTKSFSYLLTGTLLGLGLHPSAGHFIAEHYEFVAGIETYSYYGIANYFNFNVGYHNEHHDFPKVPWSLLPRVREIAPEFYDTLPHYTSYVTEVFWPYITNPNLGVWCRIKRKTTAEKYSALDKTTDKRKFAPFKVACFVGLIGSALFVLSQILSGVLSATNLKSVAAGR
jgi:sphingolipid delta-4 desaturase